MPQEYPVGHPLVATAYSKKVKASAQLRLSWHKFMSTKADALFHIDPEYKKGVGASKVFYGIQDHDPLAAPIKLDYQQLMGQEISVEPESDSVRLHMFREGHVFRDVIDRYRVPFAIRNTGSEIVSRKIAKTMDIAYFSHLAGYTGYNSNLALTFGHAVDKHTVKLRPNARTTDEALVDAANDKFTLKFAIQAAQYGLTREPYPLVPIFVPELGAQLLVCYLHTDAKADLWEDPDWLAVQHQMIAGGFGPKSPLIWGFNGVYQGIVFIDSPWLPRGQHSTTGADIANTRCAVMAGQCALIGLRGENEDGTAEEFKWIESYDDHNSILRVSARLLFGAKRFRPGGNEFGAVGMTTYAAPKYTAA